MANEDWISFLRLESELWDHNFKQVLVFIRQVLISDRARDKSPPASNWTLDFFGDNLLHFLEWNLEDSCGGVFLLDSRAPWSWCCYIFIGGGVVFSLVVVVWFWCTMVMVWCWQLITLLCFFLNRFFVKHIWQIQRSKWAKQGRAIKYILVHYDGGLGGKSCSQLGSQHCS